MEQVGGIDESDDFGDFVGSMSHGEGRGDRNVDSNPWQSTEQSGNAAIASTTNDDSVVKIISQDNSIMLIHSTQPHVIYHNGATDDDDDRDLHHEKQHPVVSSTCIGDDIGTSQGRDTISFYRTDNDESKYSTIGHPEMDVSAVPVASDDQAPSNSEVLQHYLTDAHLEQSPPCNMDEPFNGFSAVPDVKDVDGDNVGGSMAPAKHNSMGDHQNNDIGTKGFLNNSGKESDTVLQDYNNELEDFGDFDSAPSPVINQPEFVADDAQEPVSFPMAFVGETSLTVTAEFSVMQGENSIGRTSGGVQSENENASELPDTPPAVNDCARSQSANDVDDSGDFGKFDSALPTLDTLIEDPAVDGVPRADPKDDDMEVRVDQSGNGTAELLPVEVERNAVVDKFQEVVNVHECSDGDDDFGDFDSALPSVDGISQPLSNISSATVNDITADVANNLAHFVSTPSGSDVNHLDLNVYKETTITQDDDDFGDFGDFDSAPPVSNSERGLASDGTHQHDPHVISDKPTQEDSNKMTFDVGAVLAPSTPNNTASDADAKESVAVQDDDDDDFGDFGSAPTAGSDAQVLAADDKVHNRQNSTCTDAFRSLTHRVSPLFHRFFSRWSVAGEQYGEPDITTAESPISSLLVRNRIIFVRCSLA